MASQSRLSKMGDLYVLRADLEVIVNGDICEARQLLNKALQLGCQAMAAYHKAHGYVLWRTGERDEGIRELEKSVALEPCVATLSALGEVLSYEGDERAADIWARVLREEHQNCQAYIYLGILAAKTGDREKALLMAKKAETLHPTVNDVAGIGSLYGEAGEPRMALGKYLEADRLGKEPKGPLYANVAVCHFDLGNVREGCAYLERAWECGPKNTYVREIWDRYRARCVGGPGIAT
jgi:tetratricopeptide (TPR) repeat protein